MNIEIYSKAAWLVENKKVEMLKAGRDRIWFSVGDYNVYLEKLGGFSCDCQFQGVKGIAGGLLCSHVLAAIYYLRGGFMS